MPLNAENSQLAGALVGLGATITHAMDTLDNFVPCGHPAAVVIDGLTSLDAPLSNDERSARLRNVANLAAHVSEKRGVPVHRSADMSDLGALRLQLLDEAKSVAQSVAPKGDLHQTVNVWLYRALAAIEHDDNAYAEERLAELPSIKAAVGLL